MQHTLKIIYMGTPEFAVAGLKILLENGFHIVAVVTAPDKPSGRGLHLQQSPVKQFAVSNNIPVLQPEKLKNPEFISSLRSYHADLQVVVAFRMLPEIVWNMPPLGTLNLHASLLPDYRGAAPINHAIINGEKITGATTFFLKHEIDTGDIIFSEKINIEENDDAGTLHDKLMDLGADLILKTVTAIEANNYTPVPQSTSSQKIAPKIFKENCMINWNDTTENIRNFIRGLSPYPAAYTIVNNKSLKIFKAEKEITSHNETPGKLITDNKSYIKFAATDGFINVKELQSEGKKRMATPDFLRGNNLSANN